jgi:hypothetical protein
VLPDTPRLKIRNEGTNAVVNWPLVLQDFLLESRASFDAPWQLVPQPPLDENFSDHAVTVPATQTEFFRLWHP